MTIRILLTAAIAVVSALPTLADDFTISTTVTTTNGGNTVDGSDNLTVTATGSVSTTDTAGLLGTGDNISFRNDGTITALATNRAIAAHGMAITGNNATLLNTGTLDVGKHPTAGFFRRPVAREMVITGDNGSIINSGLVASRHSSRYSIVYSGNHGSILNTGSVMSGSMQYNGDHGSIISTGTYQTNGSLIGMIYVGNSGLIENRSTGYVRRISYTGNDGTLRNYGKTNEIFYTGDRGTFQNDWVNDGTSPLNRMRYSGDIGTATNNGGIIATSGGRDGIAYRGTSGTAINNGTIKTDGNSHGISHFGNFGTVVNNGSIAVTRVATDRGNGVVIYGHTGKITNRGSITTAGLQGFGIYHQFGNGLIANSGSITTSGTYGHGIWHGNQHQINNGSVSNSGTITTTGDFSFGILNQGHNGSITNRGSITTSGRGSYGILNDGTDGRMVNTGSIVTNTFGIWNKGANGTVINRGTITTSGLNSHGIVSNFANATVTNSGTISSPSFSIDMSGTNGTLNLLAGSVLNGDIRFTDPGTGTLNFGRGLNAVVKLDSVASLPNTITAYRNAYRVVGDTIYVIDTNGFAARARGIGALTGFVANRVNHHQQFGATGTAGTGNPRASTKGHAPSQDWFEAFGGARNGASSGDYSAATGGFVVGRDTSPGSGFFAGSGMGYATSVSSSFTTRNTSLFAGGYHRTQLFGLTADISLTAGAASSNGLRTFGVQTAQSSYNNYFFSPSVTFTNTQAIGSSNLIFSMGARYTALYQEGYTETGSLANLTVGGITTHILELRAQATAQAAAREFANGTLFPSAYFGIEGQHYLGGAVSSSVAGSTIGFSSSGDSDATRFFAGLNAVFVKNDTSEIRGGFEIGLNSQSVASVSANMRWEIKF